jgi:hypothetical protein
MIEIIWPVTAMFETAAEVLEGLKTAFAHYEQRGERVWR